MTRFIFGYGSLLFRPGFPYVSARRAKLEGHQRRLEQGSPDHRGTPDKLGRVATLVRDEGAFVEGLAYELPAEQAQAILIALDEREQGGYDRAHVRLTLVESGQEIDAITWIAWPGNPFHLGPCSFEQTVSEVLAAVGPSGTNVEYVLRLEETLASLGFLDDHIGALARALREHKKRSALGL